MLWTETSLLNPHPTWQLFSKLTVSETIRGNQKFASLLNTWHRIIATSLCPLRPTLNFLVLIPAATLLASGHPLVLTQPKVSFISRIYWPSLSLLPSDSPSSPGHSLLLSSGIHSTNMFWALCLRIEIQLWKWSPECLPSWNLRRREKYTDRWTCGKGCDGEEIGGIETESHSSMSSTPRNKMTTEITKFGWKLSRIHECGCEFHRHWLKEGWSYNFNEI